MTTSETSPSVHLQCLKNCLSEKLHGNCPSDTGIKDIILVTSDPEKSPTNNNNNNNNNTTTSNSNTPHLNHICTNNNTGIIGGGGSNNPPSLSFSSLPALTVYGSSPSIGTSATSVVSNSNSHCSSITAGYNNYTSESPTGTVTSGAESVSTEVSGEIRDLPGEKGECTGCSNFKITENHLSTKLLRNKSSPYSVPNSTKGVVSAHVKQNQDRSNHSQVNPSVSTNGSTGCSFIAWSDEDQVMFDNAPVNSIQTNLTSTNNGVQGSSNCISENNHNNPNLMGSTSLLTSGISGVNSNGVIHANNMVLKTEPNGNSIELTLDNQFNPHHHNHLQNFQHQTNGSDCCSNHPNHTNPIHSPLHSGDSIGNMQPHDSFLGSHNNQHNCNQNNQVCHNGLFVNSCAHNCGGMSLATGNGSMGSISGNSNGAGSLDSPGGSLELDEHDCDDDKVINDTFGGDLPDPDAIKMFVGQVPKNLNESELRTLFEEFGRVFQINVLRDKVTKQSKGCCFVTYYSRKSALDAQNALHNVKTLAGMNHPLQVKPADNENRYERKLFVGMISKKCNEADVRTMFSRFGVIDECTVLRDTNQQSKGCAFVTFASKQSAQNAIKAVHHSTTFEGCSSPVVVKFADTQKDKDQKRQQNYHSTLMGNISTGVAPISQPQPSYFPGLLKLEQIVQQLQQQLQQTSYYSQLSPLAGLGGLTSFGSANTSGIPGLGSSQSSNDLATIAALVNLSNLTTPANQHHIYHNLASLATSLGNHSSLSPTEYTYSGANGCSLGSTNALAIAGNGLQTGLSSFSSAQRSQPPATKQVNFSRSEGPPGANLFIYHLPPEFSDLELAQMFAPFGNLISAKVFMDKQTNLSKCFGFVSYDSPISAQLAIDQMHSFQIGMKRLKVELKKRKDAAKPY